MILISSWIGLLSLNELTLAKAKPYGAVSLAFFATLFANVKILQFANVETFIVFRSSTPIVISILDVLFLGRTLPSVRSCASLFGLLAGAIIYVFTDSAYEVRAYFWVACWYLIFCFDQIYIKHVVDAGDLSSWSRALCTNIFAILPAAFFAIYNKEHNQLFVDARGVLSLWVTLSCAIGVFMSVSSFQLRGLISATQFTVIGTACKIISVFINYFIWDKHASGVGLCALGLCITSAMCYEQAPMRKTVDDIKDKRILCTKTLRKCHAVVGSILFITILSIHLNARNILPTIFPLAHYGVDSKRTLTIVIGSIRGGIYAWRSFQKQVLNELNSDFAYMGPDDPRLMSLNIKYHWHVSDVQDWGSFLNDFYPKVSWNHFCTEMPIGGAQFLGGVANCQPGSAGILLVYRELLRRKIIERGLVNKYEWFVLTRSDQFHLCPHQRLTELPTNAINIASGEDYGGVSDRHTVYPAALVLEGLNVTNHVLRHSREVFKIFNESGHHMNLESVLSYYFERVCGLAIARFNRTFFGVRRNCDKTRWSLGKSHPVADIMKLKIKYLSELSAAQQSCNLFFSSPSETVIDDCQEN